ncbi:MAG: filamentous hemagglutinin family protein [Pseudomonadota bacterium]|nr:filamentous hemagglutinin family protein [Pseudomonadota bacterium]
MTNTNHSLRTRLLIGASIGSLLLAGAAEAQSNRIGQGRGGGNPAAAAARVAQAEAQRVTERNSATQRAVEAMRRAAQTRAQMNDAQVQARIAAQNAINTIPNGIGQGGLRQAPGIEIDPNLWQGANDPVESAGQDGRTTVTVDQDQQRAILTWDSFNIGRETDLVFNQAYGADAVVLNRVRDASPSQIHGTLTAPGTVLILNQNGVLFGGTSVVNVRNLIASSANILDSDFLDTNRGIYSQLSGANYLPSFRDAGGAITIEAGAQITTHAPASATQGGGYVMLMGTEVTNEGSIVTAKGQTLLSAGDDFIIRRGYGTEENQYSTTRGNEVRGLIDAESTSGTVINRGLIEAAQGDITLAGRTIRQEGVLVATTGVNQRGTIHLLNSVSDAEGSVTLASGWELSDVDGKVVGSGEGLTIILPELDSEDTALNGQRDSLIEQSETANTNRYTTTNGGFDDRSLLADRLDQSRIEIVTGGDVVFEGRSQTSAQGGQVAVQAAGRITAEDGALIDVSGVQGIALDMESNSILVNIQGNELRDSPENRENANLRSTDVWIDVRDLALLPDGTGGYEGDRWYTKGGLLEVGGHLNNMAHGIGEWAAIGGTITLAANEVVAQRGATFDISGGSLDYQAGWVLSSRVLGADGKLYDLANAPAGMKMVAWGDAFVREHSRWGEQYTQVWSHPISGARSVRRWSDGYTVGRDAGQLILSTPTAIMEGDIIAEVIEGERQVNARADGITDGYDVAQHTRAQPGSLALGRYDLLVSNTNPYSVEVKIADVASIAKHLATGDALPEERNGTAWLDAGLLNQAGLGGLNIETTGVIAIDNPLTLADGGALKLVAPTIDFNADVTAHSGSINATNRASNHYGSSAQVLLDGNGGSLIAVGEGVTLDLTGLWVNTALNASDTGKLGYLDGGKVTLASTHDLALAEGSLIDVSSGGAILAQNDTRGGAGGDVSLVADGYNAIVAPDGTLLLDGEIRGVGVLGGGTLHLETGKTFTVGAADEQGGTQVDTAIFQTGFASYELVGRKGVTVADGTDLSVVMPVLLFGEFAPDAATGAPLSEALDLWTPPTYLENPVDGVLTRRGGASLTISATLGAPAGSDEAIGGILIGRQAAINVDPGQSITLLGKNIAVDGGLYAWGGNVTLDVPRLATAVSDGYGSPEPGLIRIGSEAVIDVAARSATAVDRLGRRYGIVADGGTIALGGGLDWEDTGSAKAADAFIVIETGALLDASGTQATLDLPSTMGMPSITTQVVSDGGTIVAKSNVGLYLDGTVKAEAGGKGAAGGTLGLALESAAYRVGEAYADLLRPREFILSQEQGESLLPEGFGVNGVHGDLVAGTGYFGADRIEAGGFDNVSLLVNGALSFDGSVTLSLGQSARFYAGTYALTVAAAEDSRVSIATPYLRLAGTTRIGPEHYEMPSLHWGDGISQAPTNALFSVVADLIDVRDRVGFGARTADQSTGEILDRRGFAQIDLTSRGDLRMLAGTPGRGLPTNATTELSSSGDITLTAAQIYPATGVGGRIMSGYQGEGEAFRAGSSLTILRYDDSIAEIPYSAFGMLALGAETINQGGVVRAPFGLITIGSTFNRQVTSLVNLLPGSETSISAAGLTMPYGGTVDGIEYDYNGSPVALTAISGTDWGHGLEVKSARLDVQSGALLDLSGGGDLAGAGFMSGRGGSVDILKTALINANPGYGASASGNAVYAIVPSSRSSYAPVAPDAGYGNPVVGQQITILESVPGLAAGTYTLMPSSYALLPGAFRVEIGAGMTSGYSGVNAIGNGSYLTQGTLGIANTAIRDTLPRRVTLTSADAVRAHSGYNEMGYNAFVAADAARLGMPRAMMTSDGGTLDLAFTRGTDSADGLALRVLGDVNLAAAKDSEGYAGAVQVRGIGEVVATGAQASAGLDSASVDAGALSALEAPRLILNATLSSLYGKSGRYVTVNGEGSLTIRSGAAISAADIIMAGSKSMGNDGGTLTIEEGATLSTIGMGESSYDSDDGYIFGGLGVLALSNGWFNLFLQEENPNSPDGLYVNVGACVTDACDRTTQLLSEGTIALATNRVLTIEKKVAYGTRRLVLGVSSVNLGESAALAAAEASGQLPDGLELNQTRLAEILAGNNATHAPAVEMLELNATRAVNVYGAVDLDASSLDQLVFGTPAIFGYGADSDVATIHAGEFIWTGTDGEAGAPVAGLLGKGMLDIRANSILFGHGANTQSSTGIDERLVLGFGQVNLTAAERIVSSGKSMLSVYETRGDYVTGKGWDYQGGNLVVTAPVLTGEAGSMLTVRAGGDVSVMAPEGVAGEVASDALGAQLAIYGRNLSIDSAVILPSGKLTLSASGDLVLGDLARIDLSGRAVEMVDVTQYSWGGDLLMESTGGNISASAGSIIDLSAVNNRAGTISVTALGTGAGHVDLASTILGSATGRADAGGSEIAYNGAELAVQAQSLADFGELNTQLNAGEVFGARRFRIRQGDLTVGDGVKAQDVQIVLDGGSLTIEGTIDASGQGVGAIRLAAIGDLVVNGALDAHGTGLRVDSYGQIIDSPNRAVVDLSSTAGTLVLGDSARIDLRAGTDVPGQNDGAARGSLDLNAQRTATDDVAIDLGGMVDIQGARSIAVNAFRTYDDAPLADLPDVSGERPQLVTQAYLDRIDLDSTTFINLALGNAALSARLAGLGQYHLRPGVEIVSNAAVNPSGTLTVLGDLDMSGYRYGPEANRIDPALRGFGEPGVLVLRAAGDLNILGSITDGFAPPAATADDDGWVLTETKGPNGLVGGLTPFGGDIIIPIDGVVLDTGTTFPREATLNYDVPVGALTLPAGTVLPVDVALTGQLTLGAGSALSANIYNADGSVAYSAGMVLDNMVTLTPGMKLGAGTALSSSAAVDALIWPKGAPLPVEMVTNERITLPRGALIPSMTDVQLVDDLGINLRPSDQGFINRNWAVAPMLASGTSSWSFQLVAGADVASADRKALDPASVGTIRLADTHYSGTPAFSSTGSEILVWAEGNWLGYEPGTPVSEEEASWCEYDSTLCAMQEVGGEILVWADGNWLGYEPGTPVSEEEASWCEYDSTLCAVKQTGGDQIVWAPDNWLGMPAGEPVSEDEQAAWCAPFPDLCLVQEGGGPKVWTGYDYVAPGISVIRTGTGDLSLTAAGDIRMSSLYGIYTAGTATDPGDGYDLRRGTLPTGVVLGGDTDYSATLASYHAWYPDGGGNLAITAGGDLVGDILGFRMLENGQSYQSSAVAGNWLWRQGSGGAVTDEKIPTAWWINFGTYVSSANGSSIANPAITGFTGFGTLGGGNLTVRIGGDAGRTAKRGGENTSFNYGDSRSEGLVLAVGSTGRVAADGTLRLTGGGDMVIRIGGALNPYVEGDAANAKASLGGSIVNLRGSTSVDADSIGAVQAGYRSMSLPNPLDPRGTDPFETTKAEALSGVTLVPGDSVFTVRTLGDQVIAGAGDATRSIGLNTQPFTVNGVNYGGGGNSWFSLWTDHTAINLQSAGGDIAPGKHGIETSQTLIAAADIADTWPAILRVTAMGGDLYFGASAGMTNDLVTRDRLSPSPSGELSLLAAGSIYGGDLTRSSNLASRHVISVSFTDTLLPTPFNPAFVGREDGRYSERAMNLSLDGSAIDATNNGELKTWNDTYSLFAFGPNSAAVSSSNWADRLPVRIYAVGGDIVGLGSGEMLSFNSGSGRTLLDWYVGGGPLRMTAGRDIVASGTVGASNLIVHSNDTDVSVISAGRDIIYSNFDIAGPGTLEVTAGRNILQEDRGSFTSIGPIRADDTSDGASIALIAGMTGVNWDAVRDFYLDPSRLADPARPLGEQNGVTDEGIVESVGKLVKVYDAELAAWLFDRYGYVAEGSFAEFVSANGLVDANGVKLPAAQLGERLSALGFKDAATNQGNLSALLRSTDMFDYGYADGAASLNEAQSGLLTQVQERFDGLSPEQQRIFLRQVYFSELREGGREYNDADGPRLGSYLRGRLAVATLFPDKDADGNVIDRSGDIIMYRGSGVRTNFGGDIEMMAPGGQIVVGVQNVMTDEDQKTAGVMTQGSGDIRIFSEQSLLLGLSRIMTTYGGSILGWSEEGDINAGRGANTTVLYTPPLRTYDAYGNVRLAPQVPSSGAGIATLNPIPEVPAGDIDLIAPLGTIDAGEAGIRVSGNINLAALQVLNAANIKVQGEAAGIPVVAAVNTGALTSASSASSAVANQAAELAERARPQVRTEIPTILNVRFLGFGE